MNIARQNISSNVNITLDGKESMNIVHGYPCYLWWYKKGESTHKQWWWDNIKPEWTIIDAGANIGLFSIIFGKKAKQVYAFEPTDTVESLEKNLRANSITNVEIIRKALSYKDMTKTDTIYHVWEVAPPLKQEFEFTSIDSFVNERKIKVDAIKIDVDSYDYEVLYGAKNVLLTQRPIVIIEISEVALKLRNVNGLMIHNLMKELNYRNEGVFDSENFLFVPV